MIPPSALYAHVPFCRSKCSYCDFFSLPIEGTSEAFLERLVDSMIARAGELSERFGAESYETVYVGGGTPTALPRRLFSALLEGLSRLAPRPREWSVEANPESLLPDRVEAMLRAGVTRLSLGVQSLDEAALALLGRPHGAAEAEAALRLAAGSGLAVSADLIAALPPAGPESRASRSLAREAERLLELGVGHLSIYDLVVEEGTRIAASIERGELPPQGEDAAWEERSAAEAILEAAGFRRYEVSNYAPPGAECGHNLAYWRMDSYVGAGPGAVSTIAAGRGNGAGPRPLRVEEGGALRIEESRDLAAYPERAAEIAKEEPIAPRDAAFESIMMGMRTRFGIELDAFAERHGAELDSVIPRSLAAWSARLGPGWGEGRRLAMDARGLDLLNRFLSDCLMEMETAIL